MAKFVKLEVYPFVAGQPRDPNHVYVNIDRISKLTGSGLKAEFSSVHVDGSGELFVKASIDQVASQIEKAAKA